jgi:hypothetical protein
MTKFIVNYNIGYGNNYEITEQADEEAAEQYAYEAALEDFENSAMYECLGEATPELIEEYGLEDDA